MAFTWWRRWPARGRTQSQRYSPRVLELLEERTLLSSSVPAWVEQGPGPIAAAAANQNLGLSQEVGAVQAIAYNSGRPDQLFIGTVNGGVWRTNNATSSIPTWTPLTDNAASLAISDLAFGSADGMTLYAGTGSYSSGAFDGGKAAGILKTTDGGSTWTLIGQSTFNGLRIASILPTALTSASGGAIVLAATPDGNANAGLYRSEDGGSSWTRISGASASNLPDAPVTDLAVDTSDMTGKSFYAAVPSVGVFHSADGGLTWTGTNTIKTGARMVLATQHTASRDVAYVAVIDTSGMLAGIYRTTNQGLTWRILEHQVQPLPGGSGSIHFAMAADPTDPNVLYVAGEDASVNSNSERFRVTADDAQKDDTWASIALAGANNTAPHADARDLVFDKDGNLLEADDGGVYRLSSPGNAAGRRWASLDSNLRITEFYSVAYDPLSHTVLGGAQDNGSPEQAGRGTASWTDVTSGDGGVVAVDTTSVSGSTLRYSTGQYLLNFQRREINSQGQVVSTTALGLQIVDSTGKQVGKTLTSRDSKGNFFFDPTIQFATPYALNAVDPTRMLIGTNFLYESKDQGDTLLSLGGLTDLNHNGLDDDGLNGPDDGAEWQARNPIGTVTALAYGGRLGGQADADLAYVGVGGSSPGLWLRTAATTNTLGDFTRLTSYPGDSPTGIALDPNNGGVVYVTDASHV
jgi:photosystem II stability/assembly factor-like uncharacterized protein